MSDGGFAVTFCANVGIAENTFQEWVKKYPEFSKSYKKGTAIAKSLFLDKVKKAAWGETDKRVNNGLISLLAVNCYGMRTRDQVEKEEDQQEAQPVKVEIITKSAKRDNSE